MNYPLNVNTLKAVVICAPPKPDLREKLNGVLLDFKVDSSSPSVNIVATDGHVMAAFNDALPSETHGCNFSVSVSVDTIKAIIKLAGKQHTVELVEVGDGIWRIGDISFIPKNDTFPDYNRVLPNADARNDHGFGQRFDPKLLTRAQKAITLRLGVKDNNYMSFGAGPQDSAVLHGGNNTSVIVIMPMPSNDVKYKGFISA
jgi:DNA polymerase III sliding clamp (beta) subunit (PCNA family)